MIPTGQLIGSLLNSVALIISIFIFYYLIRNFWEILPGKSTNEKLKIILKRLISPGEPSNNIGSDSQRTGLKPISKCFGFRVSVLLPIGIGLFILGSVGLLSIADSKPLVTPQGLTNWAKQNGFVLTIISLSGPFAAIYIAHHRSEQQLISFEIQNEQNKFNNYYKKEEIFAETYQKEFLEPFQSYYDDVPFDISPPKIVLRNIFTGKESLEFITSDGLSRYILISEQLTKSLELPHTYKYALNDQYDHEKPASPIFLATNTHTLLAATIHLISLNVIKLDIFEKFEKVSLKDLLKFTSLFNSFLSGNFNTYHNVPFHPPRDYSPIYIDELTRKLQLNRTIKEALTELGNPFVDDRGFYTSARIAEKHLFYSFQTNGSGMTEHQRSLSDKIIETNNSLREELVKRHNQT